jgi:hypothetical protein
MLISPSTYEVTWEKLPDDFVLDDEPVDNINQPALAAALTESLQLAGKLPENASKAARKYSCYCHRISFRY